MRERLRLAPEVELCHLHDPAPVGRPDRVDEVRAGTAAHGSQGEGRGAERDRHPDRAPQPPGPELGEDGGGLAPELELERGRRRRRSASAQASAIIMQAGRR